MRRETKDKCPTESKAQIAAAQKLAEVHALLDELEASIRKRSGLLN